MWEDEHGGMHTGPTTSPENSYEILPAETVAEMPLDQRVLKQQHVAVDAKLQTNEASNVGADAQLFSFVSVMQSLGRGETEKGEGETDVPTTTAKCNRGYSQLAHVYAGHDTGEVETLESRQMPKEAVPQILPPPPPPSRRIHVLAFSPAIDISILRQVANPFFI